MLTYSYEIVSNIYGSCTGINTTNINGNVLVIEGYIALWKPRHRPIMLSQSNHNIPLP